MAKKGQGGFNYDASKDATLHEEASDDNMLFVRIRQYGAKGVPKIEITRPNRSIGRLTISEAPVVLELLRKVIEEFPKVVSEQPDQQVQADQY